MKNIITFLAAVLAFPVWAEGPRAGGGAPRGVSPRECLIERLTAVGKSGSYMVGHQDDPFYGLEWSWERNRSDILEMTGDYPAVMGFELGGIEMGDEKNLDSVPFTLIREEIQAHFIRGGVITVSWHPRNPFNGGTAWDTDSNTVASVLEGGESHEKFLLWMKRLADYMATLATPGGQVIPLIFRPWHENNGSWFWWGQQWCSDDEYHALWNMLQDYMKGRFDNLVWCYSPGLDGAFTTERFMRRYPGNSRVDIIGIDAYQWGKEEDFVRQLSADLDFVSSFARDNGKLFALTECGMKNCPDSTWFMQVLKPVIDRYPGLLYELTWRNYPKEYFTPDRHHKSAGDFRRFVASDNALMLKDIR